MFGISFTEVLLILAVALVVVGPQKLPSLLGTVGTYIGKLRRLATDMRRQTGIDEILRQEGLSGGLNELRNLMRTDGLSGGPPRRAPTAVRDPYEAIEYDRTREYPVEGADAYGAIPEDLADGLTESGAPNAAAQSLGNGTTPSGPSGTSASGVDGKTRPEAKATA